MSETLYESSKVVIGKYTGPANEGPDRRRYQFTIMPARTGMGEGVSVTAAWLALSRTELHELAKALFEIDVRERP